MTEPKGPAAIHVIGTSGSGKTTLIERLLPRLRSQGLRVGTVKHAHEGFEMDHPGKDTWRHARAGAEAVVAISPARTVWLVETARELSGDEALEPIRDRVDLVLIEGFKERPGRAIVLGEATAARLMVDAGRCRVGVPVEVLSPEELDRIAAFCLASGATDSLMTVRVLCFAQLRDRVSQSDLMLSLPAGSTGRELLAALCERSPAIGPLLAVSRLAVNGEYVANDSTLHNGDEVAVIPPVSGG